MAFIKDKTEDKEVKNGPRTAKDLKEDRDKRLYENTGNKRRHVNKFLKQHEEEVEARKKTVRKTTLGATQELQYIQNHLYSLEEIKDFDLGDAIDESALSSKAGHVRSKLAYKFIMENKNIYYMKL